MQDNEKAALPCQIHFRATDEDVMLLETRSAVAGMTKSAFVRSLIAGRGYPRPQRPDSDGTERDLTAADVHESTRVFTVVARRLEQKGVRLLPWVQGALPEARRIAGLMPGLVGTECNRALFALAGCMDFGPDDVVSDGGDTVVCGVTAKDLERAFDVSHASSIERVTALVVHSKMASKNEEGEGVDETRFFQRVASEMAGRRAVDAWWS